MSPHRSPKSESWRLCRCPRSCSHSLSWPRELPRRTKHLLEFCESSTCHTRCSKYFKIISKSKKNQNGFNITGILAQHHSNLTLGQTCFRPNPHGLEHPTRRMTGCPSAASAAWQCSVPCRRLHAVIPRDWMGIDGNYHGIG